MSDAPPGKPGPPGVLTPGARIGGDYEVDRVIKAGGMGEVYRAHNIHLKTPAAIKVVLPGLETDALVREAFLKEATTLQSLQHDAIVRYFNFTRDANLGRYCLIMEFVEGQPLSNYTSGTPMPVGSALALMRRLAKGLSAAHRAGVVHRDLSPDNVLMPEGEVARAKIIDFGIAKTTKAGSGTLFQDKMVGKFGFMAPEQLGEFEARIGPHTDIYSLGLMMAAVSRGAALPMGGNYAEAFRARQNVPDLDGIPEPLQPLLEWMLQPDPADRPATMAQVIEEIDRILSEIAHDLPELPGDEDATIVAPLPARDLTPRPAGPITRPGTARGTRPGKTGRAAAAARPGKKGLPMGAILAALAVVAIGGGIGAYVALQPTETAGLPPAQAVPAPGADRPPVTPPEPVRGEPAPDPQPADPGPAAPDPGPARDTAGLVPQPAFPPLPEPEPEPQPADIPPVQPSPNRLIPMPPPPEPDPEPVAREFDRVGTMLEWLKAYDTGDCTYFAVDDVSETAIKLLAYGQVAQPFLGLIADFEEAHGIEPDVVFQTITAQQCPVLDYVSTQNAEGAPSTDLDLEDDTVDSGSQVRGRLTGLGGRNVWLALIDPNGAMVNIRRFVVRETDDEARFGVALRLAEGAVAAPHMILALVSDDPMSFADELRPGAPAAQVLTAIRTRMLIDGIAGAAVVRYFRLQ